MSVNSKRLFQALAKKGLDVSYKDHIYSVRLKTALNSPSAEVLLPDDFPIEAKALKQLAQLANASHPNGGCVDKCCATPDFHPGDSGVAIGSIVKTHNMLIPAAVGSDINCGMRLHVADLSIDHFLEKRDKFVDLMRGDFFLGTRDVSMTMTTVTAMFENGITGWLDGMLDQATGDIRSSDLSQLSAEIDRVFASGSLEGHQRWIPSNLVPNNGILKDGGLATIGGGNHFVEIQVVDNIKNRHSAFQLGVKTGQLAFMIHSGSRLVGKHIGGRWREKAKSAWPKDHTYPESGLFSIQEPEMIEDYLQAEATASNYGFVNRLWLAELLRLRLREVYGDIEAPLVCDLPHNITLKEQGGWVTRKGACPANAGQPLIIPGSMGTSSYLLTGKGNPDFLHSASHGAGRIRSRFSLSRKGANETEESLGLTGVDCISLKEERRIEEAPVAYKPIRPVIDVQVAENMIDVVAELKPILTFKA